MNGFHPATAAALVAQQHTDTSDRVRHASPTNRPPWWTRVTGRHSTGRHSVRRASLALVATLAALLFGSAPAFAGPAPLIEPEPAGGTGATSSSGSFFDGWVQVGLAVLVAAVVVVTVVSIVSRVHHHQPSAA